MKKIVVTQPCTIKIKGLYENVIRNTRIFLSLLTWAEDEKVKQPWIRAGLLNNELFAVNLTKKINAADDGDMLSFTMEEVIELYYCLDICCRYYISDIGELVKQKMVESGRTTVEKLAIESKFTIGSCENIVRELKDAMKPHARFKKAVSVLNNLEIVPFYTPLLNDLFSYND